MRTYRLYEKLKRRIIFQPILRYGLITSTFVCIFLFFACNSDETLTIPGIRAKSAQIGKVYLDSAKYFSNANLDSSKFYAQRYFEMNPNSQNPLLRAEAFYWISNSEIKGARYTQNHAEALSSAKISYRLFKKVEDVYWIAASEELIASIYAYQSQIDSAKKYINLAEKNIKAWDRHSRDSLRIVAELGLTKAYLLDYKMDSNKLDSLIFYLERSADFFSRIGKEDGAARSYLNLGNILIDELKLEEGKVYVDKALNIYANSGSARDIAYTNRIIAKYHLEKYYSSGDEKNFFSAKELLKKSIILDDNFSSIAQFYLAYLYQVKLFFSTQASQEQANIDTATMHYMKMFQRAREEKNSASLLMASGTLPAFCQEGGNCGKMLQEMAKTYTYILDSSKSELEQASNELRIFEEAELIKEAEKSRKQIVLSSLGVVTGFLILFLFLFQNQRIQNLRRRLEYKMEALRAQMNPHFISNSLNAIESLMNQNRKNEATHYLIQFSHLCRSILGNSRENRITLEQEIASLEYYLSLEELRMGEDLSYLITINPGIDIEKTLIPPMLIQPYVENAIWHGIQPKKSPGRVNIDIMLNENAELTCVIEDDGIGRAKSMELKSRNVELERKGGYGMTITKERLEMINKLKGANVEIIDLVEDQDGMTGTRVIITLPYTKEK